MKKYVMFVSSVFLIASIMTPALADTKKSCDLTGRAWEQSSQSEKLSFLYGVSSVIAIEQELAQKQGKTPSIFVQGWMKTFKNDSWIQIQTKLDNWYKEHPTQADQDVLGVLWYEFMAPNITR